MNKMFFNARFLTLQFLKNNFIRKLQLIVFFIWFYWACLSAIDCFLYKCSENVNENHQITTKYYQNLGKKI